MTIKPSALRCRHRCLVPLHPITSLWSASIPTLNTEFSTSLARICRLTPLRHSSTLGLLLLLELLKIPIRTAIIRMQPARPTSPERIKACRSLCSARPSLRWCSMLLSLSFNLQQAQLIQLHLVLSMLQRTRPLSNQALCTITWFLHSSQLERTSCSILTLMNMLHASSYRR